MNFADRMSRLGTESAFEVLARARALERQGKEIIHLEIGEPDFDTPVHIRDAGKRALDDGATHYGPAAGLPELREAIAKDVAATRNIAVTPDEIVVTPGAKPIMYFVIHCARKSRRRSDLSESRIPHLRVGHQLRRRRRRAHSAAGGVGLRLRPRSAREEGLGQDQADRHQFAPEPDRGRARGGSARTHRRDRAPLPHPGPHRRDLQVLPVRRRVRVHHALPRARGPAHHPRRILEGVRDDRLAARLWRDADAAGGARDPADGELELLHGGLHPARRHRGAAGGSDARGDDGGRVQAAP